MDRSPFMSLAWMNSLKKMLARGDLRLQQAIPTRLQKLILFLLLWVHQIVEGMAMLT